MNTWTFERLEARQLLAASVVQKGGTLTISADAANDAIRVDGTGQGAGIVVVYTDSDQDGIVDFILGIYGNVENLVIKDNGGHNAIGVDDINITGNLSITTGKGADCVLLLESTVGGKVKINTGSGDDLVAIFDNSLTGAMNVNTGSGVDNFFATDNLIGGKLNANLGSGDDSFVIFGNTVATGSKVNAGSGTDLRGVYGEPSPPNVTLKSIETSLSEYPEELAIRTANESDACETRLGGDAVLYET